MKNLAIGALILLGALSWCESVGAEVVAVRFTEGVTRGFPVLGSVRGEKLAQGDLVQVARGNRVENRMVFRFADGSIYDEAVVFSQNGVFKLLSYRLIQRGPSFPETIEATVDRETERYEVRYKGDEDMPEEVLTGSFSMPDDVYNGMLTTIIKNLPAGESVTVRIIAFTPKPRLIKMLLTPTVVEAVPLRDSAIEATRYLIRPQLGPFASLLLVALPDVKAWIANGGAPAFVRFEGPLYFMGPVWRID